MLLVFRFERAANADLFRDPCLELDGVRPGVRRGIDQTVRRLTNAVVIYSGFGDDEAGLARADRSVTHGQ